MQNYYNKKSTEVSKLQKYITTLKANSTQNILMKAECKRKIICWNLIHKQTYWLFASILHESAEHW